MIPQTCALPGERPPYPGEPEVRLRELGGPITLDAFRMIHSEQWSWYRDLPCAFTVALFRRSKVRRINSGTNKLIFEAARDTLKSFEPSLHRMYAQRGWLSYLPDERADALAIELADEAIGEFAIKSQVKAFLNSLRETVETDEGFAYIPQPIRTASVSETIEETLSRWIDFIEYAKRTKHYMIVFDLHRSIVCCARVHDAVFGTSILQPTRA